MAHWISSKIKDAQSFLEQIDQQAAETLRKNERPRSEEEKFHVPAKTGGSVPLKDQLKKKTSIESGNNNNDAEYLGKLQTDLSIITNNAANNSNGISISNGEKEGYKPRPALTDSDWTELLGTPKRTTAPSGRGNGVSGIHGLRKDGARRGSSGSRSNFLVLEGKKNQKGGDSRNGKGSTGVKHRKRLDVALGINLNGKPGDGNGQESSPSARSSGVELQTDGKILEKQELEYKDMDGRRIMGKQKNDVNEENGGNLDLKVVSKQDDLGVGSDKRASAEMLSMLEKVDGRYDAKKGVVDVSQQFKGTAKGKHGSGTASQSGMSDSLERASVSTSYEGSDSDSDSGSTSDSESEQEKERREKIFAEKAAAKAVQAIKERENMIARLEGEKQSLEKILEERAKQQVQEASELQTTMMETMEAVELEKQKHNNTRMEALARLAKLEAANADLARSLAAAQKNLGVEMNQVAGLRQQLELKEVALEELRRRTSKTDKSGTHQNQLATSKGVELERNILEVEYSCLTDKIGKLEDKAKKLEENIETTRKEIQDPTEIEIELKRRLGQMTDHLIKKQAQVCLTKMLFNGTDANACIHDQSYKCLMAMIDSPTKLS
uniref:Golgin candidate 2 n=1 Tax=Rhizophora mucronata TaxID=61149 RepID=A0A2P2JI10_RHIMU